MPDVFTVLEKDHQEVQQMLDELVAEAPHGNQRAQELAEELVIEESKHEAVEELYFWPAVRQHVPGGDELADKAIEQEDEGKTVLDELRKTDGHQPTFVGLVSKFAQAGREHIAFEEQQVWPKLRQVLDEVQREDLGNEIDEGKKTAPTRPHPHGPDSAAGLKTVGAAAAVVDKARDAATHRG